MAAVAGTATLFSQVGAREDLEDMIWELFPEDTWLLTNLDKVKATNTLHEWQTDALAAAAANRQVEGDDASFSTLAATSRIGNYQQISRKTFIVSGTLEASNLAGRRSEIARSGTKLMRELKRDMEFALVGNQASSAGSASLARSSAGLESWIAGPTIDATANANAIRATTTANTTTTPGWSGGTVVSPTDGTTTGALTVQALTFALGGSWADGADPRVILAGATQKAAIDTFTSIATRFVDIDRNAQAVITGAANVIVSDYGRHTVVLHRYMRTSVVIGIDPDYLAVSFYRRPFMETLAKTGDAEKRQILAEFGLVVRNPNAHCKVVACT